MKIDPRISPSDLKDQLEKFWLLAAGKARLV